MILPSLGTSSAIRQNLRKVLAKRSLTSIHPKANNIIWDSALVVPAYLMFPSMYLVPCLIISFGSVSIKPPSIIFSLSTTQTSAKTRGPDCSDILGRQHLRSCCCWHSELWQQWFALTLVISIHEILDQLRSGLSIISQQSPWKPMQDKLNAPFPSLSTLATVCFSEMNVFIYATPEDSWWEVKASIHLEVVM